VQDHSGSTYASISFRVILNLSRGKSWGGLLWWGAVFTNNWKCQAILTFYKPAESNAPLFDVCSGVCDTPPQAEESALVRALAYFEGVLGWRIADINHVSYLQARAAHQ
jgi:hypothetical protein